MKIECEPGLYIITPTEDQPNNDSLWRLVKNPCVVDSDGGDVPYIINWFEPGANRMHQLLVKEFTYIAASDLRATFSNGESDETILFRKITKDVYDSGVRELIGGQEYATTEEIQNKLGS